MNEYPEYPNLLETIANTALRIVQTAPEPLSTRDLLEELSDQLNILVSDAKYGVTYAKTIGLIELDQTSMRLRLG